MRVVVTIHNAQNRLKRPCITLSAHRLSSLLAIFCTGVLIGAFVTYPVGINQIHRLTQECQRLEVELNSLRQQVQKYQESLSTRGKVRSDRINLLFRGDPPDYVQSAVEEEVKKRLNPHIGKELAQLDPLLLEQSLDGQRIAIEQSTWTIRVRSIRITDAIEITLEVSLR